MTVCVRSSTRVRPDRVAFLNDNFKEKDVLKYYISFFYNMQ